MTLDLLGALAPEQMKLLRLLESVFRTEAAWPTWQYVEVNLDREGIVASDVVASLPTLGHKRGIYGFEYGLIWTHGTLGAPLQPGDAIGATIAGLFLVGAFDIVEAFFAAVGVACRRMLEFSPSPIRAEEVEITYDDVAAELTRRRMKSPLGPRQLYSVLQHEPATWSGSRAVSGESWRWTVGAGLPRFCSVQDVPSYVEAVAASADEYAAQLCGLVAPVPIDASLETAHTGAVLGRAPEPQLDFSSLHPDVVLTAAALFNSGHYSQAVFEAMKALERRVREQSGIEASGRQLMAQAFGDPPCIDVAVEVGQSGRDEQEGFKLIFMGAMQGIRNPKGHELVEQDDPQRALEYLALASVLLRRLDDAADRSPGSDRRTTERNEIRGD